MSKITRANTSLKSPINSTYKGIMSTMTQLEDNSLERSLMKTRCLTNLLKQLEKYDNVETELAERILTLCIQELNVDVKNLANFASIVSILINKIMEGQCPYPSNLTESAKSILKALIMLRSYSTKTDTLRSLCYKTLHSYPDETITNLAMDELQLISDLITASVTKPSNFLSDFSYFFNLLQRILKILPLDKKTEFVKNGISIWFGLLPSTLQYISTHSGDETILATQVFESLTDELVNFDYTDNVKWNTVLQSISQSNKYPAILKSLLEKGNQNWHRLWMIFIRLLKTQIIKVSGPGGSPINSMLPVVEHAFKLDILTRCRAFECWNVLIDNFSSATNDLVLKKKVNLLIIPLKLNNAKHEKSAIAKFHTWWHLIRRFSSVLDKYSDTILISFLHYCFGNIIKSNKASSAPPGQQSKILKQLSIQALVEIIGHVKCESCIDLPKLSNKILNTQLLVTYWKDWIYSFKTALVFLSTEYEDKHKQWLYCLWQSLLSTLGELPENNVRKDLIDEVLQIWLELIQDEKQNLDLACIILDILIPSFVLPDGNKLIELLLNKEKKHDAKVHAIIMEIIKVSDKLLKGCDSKTLVHKLKPMVVTILSEGCITFEHLSDSLATYTDNPLILWTVMAETMFESHNYMNEEKWYTFLKWPLINPQKSAFDTRCAASAWLKLYNTSFKVCNPKLDTELLQILQNNDDLDLSFGITVALALLKYNLQIKSITKRNFIQELLNNILSRMEDYEQIQDIMPMLIDSLSLLLNKLISVINLESASTTLQNLNHVLRLVNRKFINNAETDDINIFLQKIFQLLDIIFKKPDYQIFISVIANKLTECYKIFESKPETRAVISNLLKLSLQHIDDASTISKIKNTLNPVESSGCKPDKTVDNGFTAPDIKKPVKAKKDKGPSIVNTVVLDGEEYVVVKPQWKFNPKNLTENQKEKLKRKREDIPALYQDLSQSQDEFKLSKWKTDSQDTSSTSSKSTSKTVGDTTTILQNIPHTDIVPNIMENLMSDSTTKDSNQNNNIKKNIPTPKSNNKPRMALKDRILRNVRNLLENSLTKEPCSSVDEKDSVTTIHEVKISSENNTPRTPNSRLQTIMNAVHAASASKVIPEKLSTEVVDNQRKLISKPSDEDLLKSAPAKLCAERPSRAKRKPKKFDDSQLIELKRRRHNISLNESQFESQEQSDSEVSPEQKSLDKADNLKNNNIKLDNNNEIHEIIQIDSENVNHIENLVSDHNGVRIEDINPDKEKTKADMKNVETTIDDHAEIDLDATVDSVVEIDVDRKNGVHAKDDSYTIHVDIAPETRIQSSEQSCFKESCLPQVESQKVTDIIISSCSPSSDDKTNVSLDESKSVLEPNTSESCKVVQSINEKLSNIEKEHNKSKNLNYNGVEARNDDQQKETTHMSTPKNKCIEHDSQKMFTEKSTSNKEKEHDISKNLNYNVVEAKNDDKQKETHMSTPKNIVMEHDSQKMFTKKSTSNKIKKHDKSKSLNCNIVEAKNDDQQIETSHMSTPKNIVMEHDSQKMFTKKSTSIKEKPHDKGIILNCSEVEANNDDQQKETTHISTPKKKVIEHDSQKASTKKSTSIKEKEHDKGKILNCNEVEAKNDDQQKETTHISTPKKKVIEHNSQNISTKKSKSIKEKPHDKGIILNCSEVEANNDDQQKETTHISTPKKKVIEHDSQKASTKKSTSIKEKEHDKSKNRNCNVVVAKNDDQQKETSHMSTPKNKVMEHDSQKSKKSTSKKSRIERKLAIDTVEGNPFLSNSSSKRNRRKILDLGKKPSTPKSVKKLRNKEAGKEINDSQKEDSVIINESEDKCSQESCSQDVIESSQDSSITTISVASTKVLKKLPVVALEKHGLSQEIMNDTQSLLDNFDDSALEKKTRVSDVKDDTVFPENKTASEEHDRQEITANLDTEPIDHDISDDVILISDEPAKRNDNTESLCCDLNTEELANADTQSIDLNILTDSPKLLEEDNNLATLTLDTQELLTETATEPMIIDIDHQNSESPQKDEIQRKQDFLNNTLEISPIKIQSPLRDQKTPSPDTSKDFVVIKLTSPVNSSGEPLEKSNSPEIFSEDKGSPDKRDLSPPREEPVLNNTSPSSSLSLKKNRPQVRTNNRAAQMLGLCVSNKTESVSNLDRLSESSDEPKRMHVSTPARKNLKMLYNNVSDNETVEESEDSANFLKLKRILPAVDSSPVGPILKRKLVDIADEATYSPANKRKRVSFHDPPVSTTVSVHKYIEPGVTRSPQNSLGKRKERESLKERGKSPNMKLPKRLDSVFKLDTALTKAVESFSENDTTITSSNDTQLSSMEQTPVVEIVRISDLDDKEPICLDLIECKDPISKIAIKLSSPGMFSLLLKELEGKIATIGDLAKLTELEVNRLCIKVPKVSVVKKVLFNYLSKWKLGQAEESNENNAETISDAVELPQLETMDVELQTEAVALNSTIMQTDAVITCDADAQTNIVPLSAVSVQTVESGSKSTAEIVHTCISEKPDFVEKLRDILDEPSKRIIAEKISFNSILQLLMKQTTADNSIEIMDQVLTCNNVTSSRNTLPAQMLFLQTYLCEKFDSKDLVLFCSKLLQKVYDKPT